MKRASNSREVWEAIETFVVEYEGVPLTVRVGDTTETGSDMLARYPNHFRRIRVRFPARQPAEERVEQATAAPGEVRW